MARRSTAAPTTRARSTSSRRSAAVLPLSRPRRFFFRLLRVDHRIPESRAVRACLFEAAAAQFAADDQIEIAVRNERRDATLLRAAHQYIGGVGGALLGPAVILDLGMEAG